MPDIYRILNIHFGIRIPNCKLNDFDEFMESFGNGISMEFMCLLFQSMKDANKVEEEREGSFEYKISILLEKSKQFPWCTGEYIG